MAVICWACPTWPGSLTEAAVLSFTSGSPAFPALISLSYCCSPLRVMKNIWLLSCSTWGQGQLANFVQSPSPGRHVFSFHIAVGCRQPHFRAPLCSMGQFSSSFGFYHSLNLLDLVWRVWGWQRSWGVMINCILSCILSYKQRRVSRWSASFRHLLTSEHLEHLLCAKES